MFLPFPLFKTRGHRICFYNCPTGKNTLDIIEEALSKLYKNTDPAQGLIHRAKWESFQDRFSIMTGLSILTHNQSADLLCPPSQENEICKLSQQNPLGAQRCQEDCGDRVKSAAQKGETIFFKCHANLHVFSIPIHLENTKVILLGGKAYYTYQDLSDFRDRSEEIGIQAEDLLNISKTLPFKEEENLKVASDFLQTVGQTLLSQTDSSAHSSGTATLLLTLQKILLEARGNAHPKEFAPLLLSTLGVLFNIDTALFLLHDPLQKSFKVISEFGSMREALKDLQIEETHGFFERLLTERQPFTSHSLFEILKGGFPEGTHRLDFFPILLDQQMEGVILVINTHLTPEEVDIISTFSHQISFLLENIRLQQQSTKKERNLEVLNELSRAMGSELNMNNLCNIILSKITEFIGADQGSLMLFNEATRELSIKAIKGLNKKIVEPIRIEVGQGIAGQVAATGEPLLVQNLETDQRISQEKRTRYKTKSFISIPLKIDSRTIGVLNLADKLNGKVFTEEDLLLSKSLTTHAIVAIERSNFFHKTEELKKISITDPLTNLLNRRYFHGRIVEELERSKRHNASLSLIMIDIDNFKRFNDRFGHMIGDEALKSFAQCLRNSVRTIDVAGRYGGEEFTVILPQTSKEDAAIIAERICSEVKLIQLTVAGVPSKEIEFTASLGLATFPEDAETLENLINNADVALYRAKTLGKNQVVLYKK